MIVKDKADLIGGPQDASGPGWTSLRLLVAADGMGFTMTETTVEPGSDLTLHYTNHIEACYCLEGTAEVTELETGKVHVIKPGLLYAPDRHDRHRVVVTSDVPFRLICTFSPALTGTEVHRPDGSYASS